MESSLHFANFINTNNWRNGDYMRVDCNAEIFKWSSFKLNFTFTTQQECDSFTTKNPGFR